MLPAVTSRPAARLSPIRARPAAAKAVALAFVFLFLYAAILPAIWNEPTKHDFGQFYMGGQIARAGAWDSLYPVPKVDTVYNPGWWYGSTSKPRYEALARRSGAGATFRFIQLPPNALLYAPLAGLSFANAYRLWHFLMATLIGLTAWQAGRVYERLVGRPSAGAAGLYLVVGLCPLTYYAARTANTGPLLSACVGLTVLALLRPPTPLAAPAAALGIVVGFYTKLINAALFPLLLAMRRWTAAAWTAGLTVAIAFATLPVTGVGVWREWLTVLFPPLQKTSNGDPNQSLYGFVTRATHTFPLTPGLGLAMHALQAVTLIAALAWLVRPRAFWDRPERVAAGATLLLLWLLIFSPASWAFYYILTAPLWGWAAWEARRSRAAMAWSLAALVLVAVPTPGSLWGKIPEPLASRQLWAGCILFGMAAWRLGLPGRRQFCTPPVDNGRDVLETPPLRPPPPII